MDPAEDQAIWELDEARKHIKLAEEEGLDVSERYYHQRQAELYMRMVELSTQIILAGRFATFVDVFKIKRMSFHGD